MHEGSEVRYDEDILTYRANWLGDHVQRCGPYAALSKQADYACLERGAKFCACSQAGRGTAHEPAGSRPKGCHAGTAGTKRGAAEHAIPGSRQAISAARKQITRVSP